MEKDELQIAIDDISQNIKSIELLLHRLVNEIENQPRTIDEQLHAMQRALAKQERMRVQNQMARKQQTSPMKEMQRQFDDMSKPEQHKTPWYASWTGVGAFRAPYAGHTIER